ncbi:ATP-binding protein [Bradyrhizobium sp. HKCCYLR20261]|uniref:ATP-binding protein n=1 Tax=Bradyrhizobium sp. HKCCYLR20261 TaxID=3420760 RepID=UPI003EB9321F
MSVSADVEIAGSASWDGISEETLTAALARPATLCVQAGLPVPGDADVVLDGVAADRLDLLITTRAAYRHSVVRIFVQAIRSRIELSEDLRIRVCSAVQEALMNAVLHGNLQIDGRMRGSLDGLVAAQTVIEDRLNSRDVGCAPIRLTASWTDAALQVTVRDSGRGYDYSNVRPAAEDGASGRGLEILQVFSDAVTVLDRGTAVRLEFLR